MNVLPKVTIVFKFNKKIIFTVFICELKKIYYLCAPKLKRQLFEHKIGNNI